MSGNKLINLLPFKSLVSQRGMPGILPLYHTVGFTHSLPATGFLYKNLTEKDFERDLDFLLMNFTPLDIESLFINVSQGKATRKPYFHITIDDGLASNYEIMAPVLYKKGIPASFFINPAFIGDTDIMHRYKSSLLLYHIKQHNDFIRPVAEALNVKTSFVDIQRKLLSLTYLDKIIPDQLAGLIGIRWQELLHSNPLYMTMAQLGTLTENGFTLGAHSWDHPEFYMISIDEQKKQINQSLDWIEKNFPQKIKSFAFPFTDHKVSIELFEWLKDKVDLSFGTAGLKKDIYPWHLQRIPVELDSLPMSSLIKKEALKYWIKWFIGKSIVHH